ncbi:YcxB family protein [Bacillus salacetis]|uniref:YcxB family protein n=1 Tax=Bacillus salacetis TaxID=2315464 RepID=A0A3A1R5A5_9BACI|nr:YcxB family protein [Bacillus salacetis]RIW36070.1 YcxB family protein [Bacillus salacetis]
MLQEDPDLNKAVLNLNGYITKKDFINHNRYHFKKFQRIMFGILFILFIGINLYYLRDVEESIGVKGFLLFFGILISFIITSLLILWAKLVNRIRAGKEYTSDQLIKNEIFLTISPEEIQQKIRKSVSYFQWSDILSVHEQKDMFRLYISSNKAILIPKTFFKSQDEIEQLRSLIKETMSKEKIKFS